MNVATHECAQFEDLVLRASLTHVQNSYFAFERGVQRYLSNELWLTLFHSSLKYQLFKSTEGGGIGFSKCLHYGVEFGLVRKTENVFSYRYVSSRSGFDEYPEVLVSALLQSILNLLARFFCTVTMSFSDLRKIAPINVNLIIAYVQELINVKII